MLVSLKAASLLARRDHGLAFFGPVNGCGTAGQQGTEVASDAELIAKTELTSKLVPFVFRTEERKDCDRHRPSTVEGA